MSLNGLHGSAFVLLADRLVPRVLKVHFAHLDSKGSRKVKGVFHNEKLLKQNPETTSNNPCALQSEHSVH